MEKGKIEFEKSDDIFSDYKIKEEIKILKQKLNDLGHNSELTYLPSVAATFAVLNISTSSHQNNDIIRIVELSREYLRLLLENSIGRHGLKH